MSYFLPLVYPQDSARFLYLWVELDYVISGRIAEAQPAKRCRTFHGEANSLHIADLRRVTSEIFLQITVAQKTFHMHLDISKLLALWGEATSTLFQNQVTCSG